MRVYWRNFYNLIITEKRLYKIYFIKLLVSLIWGWSKTTIEIEVSQFLLLDDTDEETHCTDRGSHNTSMICLPGVVNYFIHFHEWDISDIKLVLRDLIW